MFYNEFHGQNLSGLGFGCMRFKTDENGKIDQAKVNAMFDRAILAGVNYFDTAYPYLDGNSEIAMAEALSKYPRENYFLADKFPGHSLPGPVDNRALFEISLKKCRTDYFDFYLLHNINEWSVKVYESPEYHILPDILKLKEEGKIRHLGFSYHGGPELLERVLDTYEGVFEFVQIQCNYLDWTMQEAKRKYDIITSHGLGVFIMEPLRGGRLANLTEEEQKRLQSEGMTESPASYGFRFLEGLPNVKVVLSGMNEPAQVEDNLKTFAERRPLTEKDNEVLLSMAEGMKKGVPCTRCRYCVKGCPMGLDIPFLIECYNNNLFSASMTPSMRIDGLPEGKRPAACIACGKCARSCPQQIAIPDVLKELNVMYETGPKWAEMSKGRQMSVLRDLHMI